MAVMWADSEPGGDSAMRHGRTGRRGFGLAEAAFGVALAGLGIFGLTMTTRDSVEMVRAVAAAEKTRQVRDAVEAYLKAERDGALASLGVGQSRTVAVGRDRSDQSPPSGSLQALGYLPSEFVDRTPFGARHRVVVRRQANGALEAFVAQEGGSDIPQQRAALAMRRVGAQTAMVEQRQGQLRLVGPGGSVTGSLADLPTDIVSVLAPGRLVSYAVWTPRHGIGGAVAAASGIDANRMHTHLRFESAELNGANLIRGNVTLSQVYRLARSASVGQSCSDEGEIGISSNGMIVVCFNGQFTRRTITCPGDAACDPTICYPSWQSWGTGCASQVGVLLSGQSVTVSNQISGYTGSATVSCNNGNRSASGSCVLLP